MHNTRENMKYHYASTVLMLVSDLHPHDLKFTSCLVFAPGKQGKGCTRRRYVILSAIFYSSHISHDIILLILQPCFCSSLTFASQIINC